MLSVILANAGLHYIAKMHLFSPRLLISKRFIFFLSCLPTPFQLYKQCGQHEHAVSMLEDFLKNSPNIADLRVVYLLAVTLMEANSHMKALQHIELAQQVYCAGKELPLNLAVKAGICHLHLGHLEKAMVGCVFILFSLATCDKL